MNGTTTQSASAVLELVLLEARDPATQRLPAAMARALPLLQAAQGYRAHCFGPCVEEPGRYALLIWWNLLEDHVVAFRQSAAYREWKALLDENVVEDSYVRHFRLPMADSRTP